MTTVPSAGVSGNTTEAIRLFRSYTADRCDVWQLAGQRNAKYRAHIMSALRGRRVPQSQSGVNALRSALCEALDVTWQCLAECEDQLRNRCLWEGGAA